MENKDNLDLYNSIKAVPKEAQSQVTYGARKFTAINPMYRLKVLTEHFGPCGEGFRFEIVKDEILDVRDADGKITEACEYMEVALCYRLESGEWSEPVIGFGGNKIIQTVNGKTTIDEDAKKKCYTDAIGICCKNLGLGADIWWASDPSDKYGAEYNTAPTKAAPVKAVSQKTVPVKERINEEETSNVPLNVKQAFATKCPVSNGDNGKTIAELMTENRDKVRWYTTKDNFRSQYPDFIKACEIVLEATKGQAN